MTFNIQKRTCEVESFSDFSLIKIMYSHTKCQVFEKQGLYKDLEAVTTYKQMGQSYDIGPKLLGLAKHLNITS